MSEIILRGEAIQSQKASAHWLLIFIETLAVVFPVVCSMTHAPKEIMKLGPIFVFAGIVLVCLGAWVYLTVRGRIFITKGKNDQYGITILDHRRKKMAEVFTPFSLKCFSELHRGKVRIYYCYMIILDEDDNAVLQLEGQWPAMVGMPEGFPEVQPGSIVRDEAMRFTSASIIDIRKLFVKPSGQNNKFHQ